MEQVGGTPWIPGGAGAGWGPWSTMGDPALWDATEDAENSVWDAQEAIFPSQNSLIWLIFSSLKLLLWRRRKESYLEISQVQVVSGGWDTIGPGSVIP